MKAMTMELYSSCFAHGLMFHRFHKSGNPPAGQGSVTEVEFEGILNYVGTERILTPEEWISRVKRCSLHKHHLCITFDDGLRSQFDVALPILEKYKLKAFWFVFSSVFNGGIDRNEVYNRFAITEFSSFDVFVGEFLQFYPVHGDVFQSNDYGHFTQSLKEQFPFYTENDIKFRFIRNKLLLRSDFEKVMDRMIEAKGLTISKIAEDLWLTNEHLHSLHRNGHCIGLHSYDHPFEMAHLNIEEQRNQYLHNYQHISHVTGDIVECMSHPLNSYSQDTIDILSELGIVCGFRSNITPPIGKAINAHCLELAREDGSHPKLTGQA
ncbi:MAG: polysaccharide deacetylase family protein [Euryarchaeota archaeon]|nr:polysaccharide deacetylase family protein [Euryarchaeota archaeon]